MAVRPVPWEASAQTLVGRLMKLKFIWFTLGLSTGLLTWFAFDRIEAYRSGQKFEEAMKEYEATEFLADPPTYVNQELLDLELTDMSGKTAKLGELADKHEILFVNLWATWCDPCVREMPSIKRLQDRVGGDVAFFVLSNEDVDELAPFVENKNWGLPIYTYHGEKNLPAALKGTGVPRTYIIHKGEMKLEHLGAAPWDGDKAVNFISDLIGVGAPR